MIDKYRYIVVTGEAYEGMTDIIGAFSSMEGAKASLPLQDFPGRLDKPLEYAGEYQIWDAEILAPVAMFGWVVDMSGAPVVCRLREDSEWLAKYLEMRRRESAQHQGSVA